METPLFRGGSAEGSTEKGMDPEAFAQKPWPASKPVTWTIRPGVSNVLKGMSRIAPNFMLNQRFKMDT